MNKDTIREKAKIKGKELHKFLNSQRTAGEGIDLEDIIAEIQALIDMVAISTVALAATSSDSDEEFKTKMEGIMQTQPVDLAQCLHYFAFKHLEIQQELDGTDETLPV